MKFDDKGGNLSQQCNVGGGVLGTLGVRAFKMINYLFRGPKATFITHTLSFMTPLPFLQIF